MDPRKKVIIFDLVVSIEEVLLGGGIVLLVHEVPGKVLIPSKNNYN